MEPWLSITEADLLFQARPFSELWFEVDSSFKTVLLSRAQLLLEAGITWSSDAFIYNTTDATVPRPELRAALCEQALWLLQHNPEENSVAAHDGIDSISIGSFSAKFSSAFRVPCLCPLALHLIGKYGTVQTNTVNNGSINATLLEM